MIRTFLPLLVLILSGCVQGEGWQVNATMTDPIEDKCSQVIFGENTCALSEKQADKTGSPSLINKTTGLDDPLDMISFVGVNVGLSW